MQHCGKQNSRFIFETAVFFKTMRYRAIITFVVRLGEFGAFKTAM